MNTRKIKQLNRFIKAYHLVSCYLVSLTCFGMFPIIAVADGALMKPVQDIYFQELPPPWTSEPIPKIHKSDIETVAQAKKAQAKKIQATKVKPNPPAKAVHKPVVKHVIRPTPKAVVQPVAPKVMTIQSLIAAANKNNSPAQYDLGMRYQYGNGVPKSRSLAHRWLSKSAEAGNARAQYALSLFYQQHARNQQGIKKALLWLKKSADQGLADAQYSLGMMFKNGSLVHVNQAESKKWLKMASSQGHVSAQLALK